MASSVAQESHCILVTSFHQDCPTDTYEFQVMIGLQSPDLHDIVIPLQECVTHQGTVLQHSTSIIFHIIPPQQDGKVFWVLCVGLFGEQHRSFLCVASSNFKNGMGTDLAWAFLTKLGIPWPRMTSQSSSIKCIFIA
jgi:hypothetical protein